MDTSGISANSAVSAALAQQKASLQSEAQVSMLKKAIDIQAEGALALINSVPQVQSTQLSTQGLPDNLGKNINTTA